MASIGELKLRLTTVPEFCQKNLWPLVDDFNTNYQVDRGQLIKKILISAPFFLVWLGITNFADTSSATGSKVLLWTQMLSLFLGSGIFLWGVLVYSKEYSRRVVALKSLKGEIKKKTVQYLDPSFEFSQSAIFPTEAFIGSRLFPDYDHALAEDRCTGKIGQTPFDLVEVKTYEIRRTRDSKGRTTTTYVPIFFGLLLRADFNKNFSGHTTVRTDSSERRFGFIARGLQRVGVDSGYKLVELESPEFEASFKVSSTDPTQARYILTPSFMERAIALKNRLGSDIQFSFQDGTVLVAIPHSASFFEFNSGIENLSESVDGMLRELVGILEVIEGLDLNSRIWNKTSHSEGA